MKKVLLVFVFCFLFMSADLYAKEYRKEDYKKCSYNKALKCDLNENLINGTVISYGRVSLCQDVLKDGKKEWYCYEPKIETAYKDGKADGIEKIYYEDGSLQAKIPYKNGKKDGTKEEYYEDGTLQARISYKNDKPYGTEEKYHKNGNLKERIPYENGKINGILKNYDENGKLWLETQYKDGIREGKGMEYHYGRLASEIMYKNNRKDGLEKIYNWDGKLILETPFKKGRINGVQKWYYQESGNLDREVEYNNGKPVSGYKYDENGNKSKMTETEMNDGTFN